MTEADAAATSGRLLVATPLTGGFFESAVVLMLQHTGEGAHGLVLNIPMDASVSSVLPSWEGHTSAPSSLYRGGPVGLDTAMGLVRVPGLASAVIDPPLGTSPLFGGISLVDLDTPPPVVMAQVAALRIFVGYAGWTAGQLDSEIAAGAWYVVDLEPDDPFTPEPDLLWRRVLARQRDEVALMSSYTPHPERN